MGINGLLPLLKSIHKPVNLKKFEGKTIGVDAYGWLHRGAVACAVDLALGKLTKTFVDIAMRRVRMLLHFGVIPFLIFDGDYLPSKAATEKDRAARRAESRRAGLELLKAGKASQAYLELQKAIDVTPEMARQLIDELRKIGVQYIVAPYEADAQLAHLEKQGVIDGVLSEDSDLLVFGSQCLLTKLDQYGNCVEINRADFCACREVSLTGWSDAEFRQMAILSGCDYLASINNMGLKTAYRMVRKYKTIERVIRMLQFDGKYHVPKDYLEAFNKAELTFLHQRVFCPKTHALVFQTTPEQNFDDKKAPFIGAYVEPTIAQGVARGDLNPMTKVPIRLEQEMTPTQASSLTSSKQRQPRQITSCNDTTKGGGRIESFFSPRRIPLAELDPNCFTASPSQQNALQRNSGPWLADEVNLPYLHRPASDTQSAASFAPLRSRTHLRQMSATPATVPQPRPIKRARLCAESNSPVKDGVAIARSRYFPSETLDPSPSTGRNARHKRTKKPDICIFSDDSIDEALSNLSESGNAVATSESAGLAGVRTSESSHSNKNFLMEHPTGRKQPIGSQFGTSGLAQAALTVSSNLDVHAFDIRKPQIQNMKPKLDLQQTGLTTPPATSDYRAVPSLRNSISTKPSRIPLASMTSNTDPNAYTLPKKTLTPLQRLGIAATICKHHPLTPPITPTTCPTSITVKSHSILSRKSQLHIAQTTPNITVAANVPLPPPDEGENFALTATGGNGSEDLIIPDTDEDEPISPCSNTGERKPALNLATYVYTG